MSLLVAYLLFLMGLSLSRTAKMGPDKRVFVDGQIMLGALFPIHQQGLTNNESCGQLQEDGIQPLEVLLYTLDRINNDENLLPGINLGVLAFDSCNNIVHALDQCLYFIKGFLARSNQHEDQFLTCEGGDIPKLAGNFSGKPVVGIIGDQSSDVSVQVATLLRIFRIPQISYLSTSPTLADRGRFGYFFRTVPSDVTQTQAILEIMKYFKWTLASVVYSDSEYGLKGYEALVEHAKGYDICFAAQLKLSDKMNETYYDKIVQELSRPQALAVVIFTEKAVARELMAAVKRANTSRKFIWIGSDGWSSRDSVTKDLEDVIEGAIAVQPGVHHTSKFQEYFKNLRPNQNIRNPWFQEYWEDHFNLSSSPGSPWNRTCANDLEFSPEKNDLKYLHFVRDAVYAFAHALHNLHQKICEGRPTMCPELERQLNGDKLKAELESVTFQDENNRTFKFYEGFDGPPRYSILNFRKRDDGIFEWKEVGTYLPDQSGNPVLEIVEKDIRYNATQSSYPLSICSQLCDPTQGFVKAQSNDSCCPPCITCGDYDKTSSGHCEPCEEGKKPSRDRSSCVLIPEEIVDYRNPWAAGSMAFAALGIFLTSAIGVIFWKKRETPVIKASGRELSALLLVGTFLSFAKTFLITSRPTIATCALIRFSLGLTYTICFAAIAVKTNRIARIFGQKSGGSTGGYVRAKYISPQSQLAITGILIMIEVIINVSWLVYVAPQTKYISPTKRSRVLICEGMDDYSYLVGLVYPFLLVCCCTIYAFQTRKCPGAFNEARYIAFTTYTTCVLWLAFVPLFLASVSSTIRVVTLAMSLSIGGMVQLACMFAPKVYIVLCKPEKNTREGVMGQRSSSYAMTTPPVNSSNGKHNQLYFENGKLEVNESSARLDDEKDGQSSTSTLAEDTGVSSNPKHTRGTVHFSCGHEDDGKDSSSEEEYKTT